MRHLFFLVSVVSVCLLTSCYPRHIYYTPRDDRLAVLGDSTPGSVERTDEFSLMTQVTSPIPPALYVRVGIHNVGDAPIRYDASTLTVEWPGATISDSNLYANGLKTSMGRTFEIETGGELSILYIVWCREAKVAPDTVIIWPGVISSEHKEVVVDSIQYILRSTEE